MSGAQSDVDGPLYHYAESEPDLVPTDFGEPVRVDEGYLPVDVEYEQPEKVTIYTAPAVPAPPRRLSIFDPTSSIADSAPDPPPPRIYPKISVLKDEDPGPTRRYFNFVGLFGLVGLAGLAGASLGGAGSSGSSLSSQGTTDCIVGTVQWSASSLSIPGHTIADGSSVDPDLYPEFVDAVGGATPNLIGRYARGDTVPGATMEASVDASSLSVHISDPGHSHVDSTSYSVLRDGQYSLAHLYSFTTSGMNLKDAGPAIVASRTGISAHLDGGSETRPASITLVPHICIGPKSK